MKLNHNISFVGHGMVRKGEQLSEAQILQLARSQQPVCLQGQKECKPLPKPKAVAKPTATKK